MTSLRETHARPLFPPEVYAKVCTVSERVDPYLLEQVISKALDLSPDEVRVFEKEYGGSNCIWDEIESVSLSDIRWLSKGIPPFVITAKRVASLTEPVNGGRRILGIVSTSDVVVEDLFEDIVGEVSSEGLMGQPLHFRLSPSSIANISEQMLRNITSVSLQYPDRLPFSFTYHQFAHQLSAEEKARMLKDFAKSDGILSLGIVVEQTPLSVSGNQLTIHDVNVPLEKLPFILKQTFSPFLMEE